MSKILYEMLIIKNASDKLKGKSFFLKRLCEYPSWEDETLSDEFATIGIKP